MTISSYEKLVAYLVLICGLSVSAVAVYYSVVGLTAIFAAAFIPVIIMGTVLEISKLVATVWLKQYWTIAPQLIRLYLVMAVILLMAITSMGIFGFLSRAHIDQTTGSQENQAQIQRLAGEISRQEQLIQRSDLRIRQLETGNVGQDAQLQRQIDLEQSRIDAVLKRIEPAIQEQNNIISSRSRIGSSDQIQKIDQDLAKLQNNLDNKNIADVQSQVGTQPDGQFGPMTQRAVSDYRNRLLQQKNQINEALSQAQKDPVILAARAEIQRIRSAAEQQVNQSNQLINRLRSQLGQSPTANIDQQVDQLRKSVTDATQEIQKLQREKFQIEGQLRQLEAEVGPIKYIAKFIYGDQTDRDLLEKAVTWMIILLIVVFDPLAVILLLASQISFQHLRQKSTEKVDREPEFDIKKHAYLFQPWTHFQSNTKIYTAVEPTLQQDPPGELDQNLTVDQTHRVPADTVTDVVDEETLEEKEAQRIWKQVNPEKTLKDQRDKYNAGILKELPWQQLITPLHVDQFGEEFPLDAAAGQLFCKIDQAPTVIYKFFENQWLAVESTHKNYYSFDDRYIDWLIDAIDHSDYDQNLLTETEKQSIKDRLNK